MLYRESLHLFSRWAASRWEASKLAFFISDIFDDTVIEHTIC
jgi:hypothetical protein